MVRWRLYKIMNNYDDIINLSRPKSNHSKLSIEQRAVQFAPFAALIGFEEGIKETERITEERIYLEDDMINDLNLKIKIIKDKIKELPEVTILYFVKDLKKSGGKYDCFTGKVKKVDEYNQNIVFENSKIIYFNDIVEINLL